MCDDSPVNVDPEIEPRGDLLVSLADHEITTQANLTLKLRSKAIRDQRTGRLEIRLLATK